MPRLKRHPKVWLGHSSRIAERHYLQTTEAHWGRAIVETTNPDLLPPSLGGNAGGNIPANLAVSSDPLNEKIPEKMTVEGVIFSGILETVPPQGLEFQCYSRGNFTFRGNMVSAGVSKSSKNGRFRPVL